MYAKEHTALFLLRLKQMVSADMIKVHVCVDDGMAACAVADRALMQDMLSRADVAAQPYPSHYVPVHICFKVSIPVPVSITTHLSTPFMA